MLRLPEIVKWLFYLLLFGIGGSSCKKFLSEKPNQELVIPQKVDDLQSLLDNYPQINCNDPGETAISSDYCYLTDEGWQNIAEKDRKIYRWDPDNIYEAFNHSWATLYQNVLLANVVLEGIRNISESEAAQAGKNTVEGHAYFVRAYSFLQAVLIWSLAYDPSSASTDLGIVLRLDPDFNKPSKRASVAESYEQIIADLQAAINLLPNTPVHVMRPSKAAALGLLARTYLAMRIYDSSYKYADLCFLIKNNLMDYNSDEDINHASQLPFRAFNKEVIYHAVIKCPDALYFGTIDSILYRSYHANDLRKQLFFFSGGTGVPPFKGTYDSTGELFSGIATDEILLTRAESLAYLNKIPQAMADLNTVLQKRWKSGTFVPLSAPNKKKALQIIRKERQKELILRGLRWMDIKRYNKEGENIVLKRVIHGEKYMLTPNSNRYALPIPADVIELSKIPQNPR